MHSGADPRRDHDGDLRDQDAVIYVTTMAIRVITMLRNG
jgi:hypothetical protein